MSISLNSAVGFNSTVISFLLFGSSRFAVLFTVISFGVSSLSSCTKTVLLLLSFLLNVFALTVLLANCLGFFEVLEKINTQIRVLKIINLLIY